MQTVKTIQHTLKVVQIVNNFINLRHQSNREEGGAAGGISCVVKIR